MIERLSAQDLEEATRVYMEGLRNEIPPGIAGEADFSFIRKDMEDKINSPEYTVFVSREESIDGLLILKGCGIEFMCAVPQNRGTGKKLLACLAPNFDGEYIHVLVSEKDERARHFYASCGFEFLGKTERKGVALIEAKVSRETLRAKTQNI
jgi:hypothetical protein